MPFGWLGQVAAADASAAAGEMESGGGVDRVTCSLRTSPRCARRSTNSSAVPPKSGRKSWRPNSMSSPPGPNRWTATPRRTCAAHAGTPGCPTTRSHNGSVGRAAIALWIVSASARFVQAARSGDPGRPCTGAVDPAERKVSPLRLARVPGAEHAGAGFSSLSRGLDQGAARGEFGSRAPPRLPWLLGRMPILALVSLRWPPRCRLRVARLPPPSRRSPPGRAPMCWATGAPGWLLHRPRCPGSWRTWWWSSLPPPASPRRPPRPCAGRLCGFAWSPRRSPRTEGAVADGGRAVPPIPPSLGPVGATGTSRLLPGR